ncbi:MAG TPA: hypothetical protein IAC19_03410 [Candidatus Ventricola gallistercoris]|nr:hypothetical protein [Candidatus Ventricola gallistercoris]
MHPFLNLAEGETRLGAFLSEVAAPNLLRIYKVCGLDYVIIDCEHGYFSHAQVAALCAVANGIGLMTMVRIPSVSREHIQKVFDLGADAILVPMTGTAEQIRKAVEYAKYFPEGKRGASTMRPHSEYQPGELSAYMKKANARTMVFAQIETDEGVKNAMEIASVPGVSGLLVGPNDLSIDYGTPGASDTPEMESAYRAVVKAGKAQGKPTGIITGNMKLIHHCRDLGMQIFSCNSEVGLLAKQLKAMVAQFNG